MKSTSVFMICLSLIFFAAAPALSATLYESVCYLITRQQDVNDCLILLNQDSRITSATNYHDLSKFILELAATTARSVYAYLIKEGSDFPNDQAIRQCASVFYPATIVGFENALAKLDKNDPQSAKNDIQAAGNGPGLCEKALQGEKFFNPPMTVRNNQVFVLSEAALLSVSHLT
ncbi:unnamed protein product [Vicia faba]|uniref:Pectinesterase inhibitor domain-containing protein n=1 Tax=Vicia faba TaxID=3906 RepID=A0AAV0Z5J9_VICFA|nr:unnamed protein product [Vicia faba]